MSEKLKKKPKIKPDPVQPVPGSAYSAKQMSLFQNFMANTEEQRDDLSNAVDLWDSIPRYAVSRQRMNAMRTKEGFLLELEIPFRYRGKDLKAVIHPARVKGRDGQYKAFYPSGREELVEHALRKICADQHSGFFDEPSFRSGARFSLYQLRKELEQQGHRMDYEEVIEALHVLALSHIEIEGDVEDGGAFAVSSYLSALSGVKRNDYEADRSSKWVAQFHPLVTQSIARVTYRQFNYERLMKCKSQLARWLFQYLVLKYTQAALVNTFEIRYSTIKRDSALLGGYKLERQAVAALDEAWQELKALGTIYDVEKDEQRGTRGKLLDVVYVLRPSREFVQEQKAANRRSSDTLGALPLPVEE